ncbi:hypothetical protein IMX26_14435 [Clostridium sp. 'deep sea']|uniref:hypothetical protein n=1 Tax=Clostridium sp. 'deep sea' TaxID=2779445 RepID=UPI0018968E3D|nr:hypothetical protein [Clostridium sp. 'deep sea']QOR34655.1 hypothetical protein IMX26_14435 [Clostridium sp. 'deep sea']
MKNKIIILFLITSLLIITVYYKNNLQKQVTANNSKNVITLSMFMTKKDIIEALGEDYEEKTSYGDYVGQYTELIYDGISLIFTHENGELSEFKTIDSAYITSNKYTFSNQFTVGENALNAIKKCSNIYENAYTHHQDKYLVDIFDYKECNKKGDLIKTKFSIKFEYNLGSGYESLTEFPHNETIKTIFIFEVLD